MTTEEINNCEMRSVDDRLVGVSHSFTFYTELNE